MAKFWNKIKYDWQFWVMLGTIVIISSFWVYNVSAQVIKVPHIEEAQTKLDKRLTRIDYNVYLIGKRFGLPLLPPGKDE